MSKMTRRTAMLMMLAVCGFAQPVGAQAFPDHYLRQP
jgi:hypothetical protein